MLGFGFREQPRTWYWTKLLEGIQETASLHNQHILLLDSQLARVIELVDGVLLSDLTAEYQVRALPPGLACVSLLHPLRGRPGVSMDDFSAGQVATEYLLELGHRRIACIELPESISRRRIAGFYDAMENAGLEINPRWVRPLGKLRWPNPHFEAHSYAMVSLWLQQDWRELGCTAILAQNDLVATGATRALQAAGLDVPGDVSVIGFDGGEICDHLSPRLTSVTLPLREMGALGMQMLMDHIEGKPVLAANTMLPPRLDIRESTGPPPESN